MGCNQGDIVWGGSAVNCSVHSTAWTDGRGLLEGIGKSTVTPLCCRGDRCCGRWVVCVVYLA